MAAMPPTSPTDTAVDPSEGFDLRAEDAEPDEAEDVPPVPDRLVRLQALVASGSRAIVHEDFNDGHYTGSATSMRVKPRILTVGPYTFLRITGSKGDCQSVPSSLPNKNRSTITFTSHYSTMPLLTPANAQQTYRARLRSSTDAPVSASLFELFQGAPGGEGSYGTQNGTGPAARIIASRGQAIFETRYQNETKMDRYPLGVSVHEPHTYEIRAVWSHDPKKGRFEVFVDGERKHTIAGRDVCMGPQSNRLPMVKLGLYGEYATGYTDIDEIHVYPTGQPDDGGDPPPPEPEPTPLPTQIAVNVGGPAYTAADGTVYEADRGFAGGHVSKPFTDPVAGTDDPRLYQDGRHGAFTFAAPLRNGAYTVRLQFCENYWEEAGLRVFDVALEDETVLRGLDLYAVTGLKTAYDCEFPVEITDELITIACVPVVDSAKLSALRITPRAIG